MRQSTICLWMSSCPARLNTPGTILHALSFLCFPGGTRCSQVVAGDVLRGALLVGGQHPAADLKPRSQRPHGGAVQRTPSHLAVPAAVAAHGPGPSCGRPWCWPRALAHASSSWHAVTRLQIASGLGFLGQLWRLTGQCSGPSRPGWLQGSTSESVKKELGQRVGHQREARVTVSLKFLDLSIVSWRSVMFGSEEV